MAPTGRRYEGSCTTQPALGPPFRRACREKEVRVIMRKVLIVVMIAAVTVLAFSVVAMAKPSEPANEWGQYHKFINALDRDEICVFENWGQLVKLYKPYVEAGYYESYGVYTWGDFVAWTKTLDLPQP